MRDQSEILQRAQQFCAKNGLILGPPLGSGVHGSVFTVESQSEKDVSAIKIHDRELFYRRERNVYLRLREEEVTDIRGCAIPEMVRCDDALWVIEMTVVTRPFVLDFAGAYLDIPPEFSEDVLADWRTEKEEQFESRWAEVQAILGALEDFGVFMVDVNPGNISFGD